MSDIVEFLLARIAEDEEVAQSAHDAYGRMTWAGRSGAPVNELIVRFHPTRLLAECAAKRAILAIHETYTWAGRKVTFDYCSECQVDDGIITGPGPCTTQLALAQPYAEHPDFDPAWRAS